MRIVDTHCHLIYLDKLSYPWLAGLPALNRNFPLTDYWPQAKAAGITDVVHMEVDVATSDMEAETEFIAGLGKPVVALIPSCRPEEDGFAKYVERAAAVAGVKGFRRVLHTQPDELGTRPIFAENLRHLASRNLSFDLCVLPRQLPIATKLARKCPDVQFIVDHCGVPNVKDRELDPWRQNMRSLAALPNVACKISGIVAYGDPVNWTGADLKPFFEHCIEAFGWDRVVWGSDWPVCTLTADLGRWVAATHELLAGTSDGEKERLLSRNAERIYWLA
jgi:predicted TIM-barrel fold metal-dependent hydrolase